MENYNVLHKLGKGAQGSVFLVEDKQTKQKCVLKKVECGDESEANKAFKEAVALQNLNHPYICGYKEFFVVWDQQDYAIFVCIVMDYYHLGDLDRVLKQRRGQKKPLEDSVMKKWIGQLIEALHYVHCQKMIHRDLKPSNIFLKDDMSITIGDFGVATVMGNVRTVTRTAVGSMSWMAPEILDVTSHYDERSDIWSLGCIVLEMATCGFMDSSEVTAVLFQLKDNPTVLEEALTSVNTHYCPELSQFIRISLRRAFKQRPSSAELLELPFIQECLGLSSSHLYKGKLKGGDANNALAVPLGNGLSGVVGYLVKNMRSEACVLEGLKALLDITTRQDQTISDDAKKIVLSAMREFPSIVKVQVLACNVLENISCLAVDDDILFGKDFIGPVLQAMRSHSGSVELQRNASALIMTLSVDEGCALSLGLDGGVQDILAAIRSFPNDVKIVSNCCTALWSLSVIDSNLDILTKERGIIDVCNSLRSYGTNTDIVDAACSALWSLSMDDDNLAVMADHGIVDLLLEVIKTFDKNAGIVKFACATLSSLTEVHEVSAYNVVHSEKGVDGLPVLLSVLRLHSGSPDVTETLASLFQDLAEYDELREELRSLKVTDKLKEVQKQHYPNQSDEVGVALQDAVCAIGGTPAGAKRPSSAAERRANSAKLRAK